MNNYGLEIAFWVILGLFILTKLKVFKKQHKYFQDGGIMVVKVDKSKEFVKSGKVLISEYPAKKEKDVKPLSKWR